MRGSRKAPFFIYLFFNIYCSGEYIHLPLNNKRLIHERNLVVRHVAFGGLWT